MKSTTFIQKTNQEADVKAILDGYEDAIGHRLFLAEGLQKDAIQNSWDARLDIKKWKCTFAFKHVGKNKFLSITDEGTKGLIGTPFKSKQELSEILLSERGNEHLAYFCNSNWSVKGGDEGGNRGRGKVMFLCASKDREIFFDSFRSSDDRYVLVKSYLDKDKEIKYDLFWDEHAINKLSEISQGKIEPLKKYGTRVLILNPKDEIIRAIKRGNFLSYINNTWWEIIKKYNATIVVKDDGFSTKIATLPQWYEEKKEYIKVDEIKEKRFSSEIIQSGTTYKINKFVLRYSPNKEIPVVLKGIAIQRGGMTIERIKTEKIVREEGMSDIYGWVEMHTDLTKEIKNKCESPEHFNFKWNKNPARILESYIKNKIRDFAKELELIKSDHAKKSEIQRKASYEAIKTLTPLFKKLGLVGKGKGATTKKIASRKPNEPLRLSASDFTLPNENSRVNYGQEIKGTYVIPINEFNNSFMVLIRVYIESEEGIKEIIQESQINLHQGKGQKIGTDSIKFIKEKFKKGGYTFKAQMISLEDTDEIIQIGKRNVKIEKGTIIYDRIHKKFYVEADPHETAGPFNFQPRSSNDKRQLISWVSEDNAYIFYYNDKHPKIRPLVDDAENLEKYLVEQGAILMYQIKFENLVSDGDDGSDKEFSELIKFKRMDNILPILFEKYSEFLWDYLE